MLFVSRHSIPCPYCRTDLKKLDIKMTSLQLIQNPNYCKPVPKKDDQATKIDESSFTDFNHKDFNHKINQEKRINMYGTKLSYLIEYLGSLFKSNNDNRVIIFSQYDKLLKMTGKVLDEMNYKHIYLKGNVNVISKNITKFKKDKSYRIIMLSSEFSSSGNNLTEASHIVFLDVLNANADKTKDIESQAIGRAVRIGQNKSVVIKRLIMKDTIEEKFYNDNKYNIKAEYSF